MWSIGVRAVRATSQARNAFGYAALPIVVNGIMDLLDAVFGTPTAEKHERS